MISIQNKGKALLLFISLFTVNLINAQTDVINYVDPFIGVDGGGGQIPGACLPFSMVRLSPDCPVPNSTHGYSYYRPIVGFSHTHVTGTGGGGRYGNVMVIPQRDEIQLHDYSTEKSDETASPGYYSVYLKKSRVKAELTLSSRCGFHRYTFKGNEPGIFMIDACKLIKSSFNEQLKESNYKGSSPPNWDSFQECLGGTVEIISENSIEGSAEFQGGWGPPRPYQVYFSAEFDQSIADFGVYNDTILHSGDKKISGRNVGAYVSFENLKEKPVLLKVGISFVSIENARQNRKEIIGWDFDKAKEKAENIWRSYLNKIQIQGGSNDDKVKFYTAFYHTIVMPTDVSKGENPRWESDEPHYWDFYCIWDTFRCLHPFFSLVIPDKQVEMVRCLIDIYEHTGWLPDAWISGGHGNVQGGSNADVVIADAIVKGLKGFDYEKAYQAIYQDGKYPSDNALAYGRFLYEYAQNGYCSTNIHASVSRTLEYAYNDYCIALVAKKLGKKDDYNFFVNQSMNCYNLFNPETKLFEPKSFSGEWMTGKRTTGPKRYYYEGSPLQYSFYVPHDVEGLVQRHGGKEKFITVLDDFFEQGKYNAHNEPDILAPYLYNYVGRPDRTAERVSKLLETEYRRSRDGIPGNDDAGTMSSWYLFGAMGFYPNAGQDIYLIGTPLFEKATVDLGNGKELIISAKNIFPDNIYIQSAKLNGKSWDKAWFQHSDIISGAKLEFEMGPKPSGWGTKEVPPSSSNKTTTKSNQ